MLNKSVEFDADLDAAIRSNILGSLKMIELAKKMKHLENFLHVQININLNI